MDCRKPELREGTLLIRPVTFRDKALFQTTLHINDRIMTRTRPDFVLLLLSVCYH